MYINIELRKRFIHFLGIAGGQSEQPRVHYFIQLVVVLLLSFTIKVPSYDIRTC